MCPFCFLMMYAEGPTGIFLMFFSCLFFTLEIQLSSAVFFLGDSMDGWRTHMVTNDIRGTRKINLINWPGQ